MVVEGHHGQAGRQGCIYRFGKRKQEGITFGEDIFSGLMEENHVGKEV